MRRQEDLLRTPDPTPQSGNKLAIKKRLFLTMLIKGVNGVNANRSEQKMDKILILKTS